MYIQCPLPESVGECKEALTQLFPHVWDTKFLSVNSAGKYWDTTLGRLYENCVHDSTSAPIVVKTAEGFGKYGQDGSRAHEAAYDAYMTGVCLAKLRLATHYQHISNTIPTH